MASERGHDGTLPRDGRGRLGEHMGVAHVRATARGEGRAMRERARTGVFAGWLCAAVVLALAPLTPAPAAAHDQSFSYIDRSEEHTSELQSHSFISYAVFCL